MVVVSTSTSGYDGRILMVCIVILLCITVGCMNFGAMVPSSGQGGQGSQVGPGGVVPTQGSGSAKPGGSGSGGGSSAVRFPQNHFTFDCYGEYIYPIGYDHQEDQYGKFTLTGNIPFQEYDFDYLAMGYGAFVSKDPRTRTRVSPMHILAERWGCYDDPDDTCKPCHFIYDGDIYASGMIEFNQSAGSERLWTATFTPQLGDNMEMWQPDSIRQTEGSCPIPPGVYKYQIISVVGPANNCFTYGYGTPFSFTTGSGFVVPHPNIDHADVKFTTLMTNVVFSIGRAPS